MAKWKNGHQFRLTIFRKDLMKSQVSCPVLSSPFICNNRSQRFCRWCCEKERGRFKKRNGHRVILYLCRLSQHQVHAERIPFVDLRTCDREELVLPGLREDENMGETYSGSATKLPEQRTDRMMVLLSITLVCALVVGGFTVAANLCGRQDQRPTDNDQQIIAMDHFDPAGTAQLQALREPDFVMDSECGCWGPFNTEQGWINWDGYFIPSELPLCINNDTLANWYVNVLSYGGYTPFDGYITVNQKDEFMGTIFIHWTDMGKGDYTCCTYNWWMATFYVHENFCLDSNQYPEGYCGDGQYIPDKEVYFDYTTKWTGCGHVSQHFTIIHSQSYRALSRWIILAVKPPIPYQYPYPAQSDLCDLKTMLVYNIFELKKSTMEE
jgi:hypothetical protein